MGNRIEDGLHGWRKDIEAEYEAVFPLGSEYGIFAVGCDRTDPVHQNGAITLFSGDDGSFWQITKPMSLEDAENLLELMASTESKWRRRCVEGHRGHFRIYRRYAFGQIPDEIAATIMVPDMVVESVGRFCTLMTDAAPGHDTPSMTLMYRNDDEDKWWKTLKRFHPQWTKGIVEALDQAVKFQKSASPLPTSGIGR